jgi:glycosyltransferase involved in cell wall biosynthesis
MMENRPKVLMVNTWDLNGGAARAAYRLHHGLRARGAESILFVKEKSTDDPTVVAPEINKWERLMTRAVTFVNHDPLAGYRRRTGALFSPSFRSLLAAGIERKIRQLDPDIVHLNWINEDFFSIGLLEKIRKPIVWTLHDMWPFTGGCHYDSGCGRYASNCGSCPVLGSSRPEDLSSDVQQRKKEAFSRFRGWTAVAPSRWLGECAERSALFRPATTVVIPYGIDCSVFKPMDKKTARKMLNLEGADKIVLFGAMHATRDPRKGGEYLVKALQTLSSHHTLVIFGSSNATRLESELGRTIKCMGALKDDLALVVLYSAADVTVVPSVQENLSNIVIESMACGTPVVAFDIGGNADMVKHTRNGYLARPLDHADLAAGIQWVLDHSGSGTLAIEARQYVLDHYQMGDIADQFLALYNRVLANSGN